MKRTSSNTGVTSLLNQTCTPALFAHWVSAGTWKMARHLTVLDRALTDIAAGKLTRLIVQMPPRYGKSELLGRYFPAWYLGTFPDRNVMYASYQAKQAALYGRLALEVFEQYGRAAFGLRVSQKFKAGAQWKLHRHAGGMYAVGINGALTGKGAHVLIIDDPIKNNREARSERQREHLWDWFHSTALTRLEPGGAVILNMTRWHKEDLIGQVLEGPGAERWRVLRFPALCEEPDELGRQVGEPLWPQRFPLHNELRGDLLLEGVLNKQAEMPRPWWEALYQQRPPAHLGNLWAAEDFAAEPLWFDRWPERFRLRVLALDPAVGKDRNKGDYSAYVLLGIDQDGIIWVEADLQRGQPPGELVESGLEHVRQFRPDSFCIEANSWQELLREQFETELWKRGMGKFVPEGIVHTENKERRIERLDCVFRDRRVRFRRTPGTELLVKQLREFPTGKHDDGPDAMEMAVTKGKEIWQYLD